MADALRRWKATRAVAGSSAANLLRVADLPSVGRESRRSLTSCLGASRDIVGKDLAVRE